MCVKPPGKLGTFFETHCTNAFNMLAELLFEFANCWAHPNCWRPLRNHKSGL